jgi:hypothetical protein
MLGELGFCVAIELVVQRGSGEEMAIKPIMLSGARK